MLSLVRLRKMPFLSMYRPNRGLGLKNATQEVYSIIQPIEVSNLYCRHLIYVSRPSSEYICIGNMENGFHFSTFYQTIG